MDNSPWVEKYRPMSMENIVLTNENRKILQNMLHKDYIPNLLFHGPPGTGKTTTIMSFIEHYFKKQNINKKGFTIHLNASDERGVEIIRNQIHDFVNSKTLFYNGLKFIILDEVDYMTKTAQQSLRYLLQNYNSSYNVRFCLICNYLNKIDDTLRDEFVKIHFDKLPLDDIKTFLISIVQQEGLDVSNESLNTLQELFGSDLRSMINYLQINDLNDTSHKILNNQIFHDFYQTIQKATNGKMKHISTNIRNTLQTISTSYGIPIYEFICEFIKYNIRYDPFQMMTKQSEFLIFSQEIIHSSANDYTINYFIHNINTFLEENNY
jgi:replication factor C subunit 3/5